MKQSSGMMKNQRPGVPTHNCHLSAGLWSVIIMTFGPEREAKKSLACFSDFRYPAPSGY